MTIYDAAMRYKDEGVPLVVMGGAEYGTGSSRDWAAKGTLLLGVAAVIARSFERIHRSNLVGMGVLPLVFEDGQDAESLGLTPEHVFDVEGLVKGAKTVAVTATAPDGQSDAVRREGAHRHPEGVGVLREWRHPALRVFASLRPEPVHDTRSAERHCAARIESK